MDKIVILGSGGHAKAIVDTIENDGKYEIAGFISNGTIGEMVYKGYSIIGTDLQAEAIFSMGIKKACMGIGFMGQSSLREKIFTHYEEIGFIFPTIIDPTATIANGVIIDDGTYVGKRAVVNSDAKVGKLCIINTGAVIEHECTIDDFSHISVSAVICGQCYIGKQTLIGANATVIQNVHIGSNSIIGAGAVVTRDIENDKKMVGSPAREILED